jgi:hypothetical protein
VDQQLYYSAFVGETRIAYGSLETVLPVLKARFDSGQNDLALIFDDRTGKQVDFDLRGTLAEVLARAVPSLARTGPGRPRLGVVSREVSLLPSHWEWLEMQPNGASAALRRLVDQASKREPAGQRARLAKESTGRFLSAMAGNLPDYEEANRALYQANRSRFEALTALWPADIRDQAARMSRDAFDESSTI